MKSVNHLFLFCPFAVVVWQYISHLFGVALDRSISKLFSFQSVLNISLSKHIFSLLLNAIILGFYFIWHASNTCVFDDILLPLHKVFSAISHNIQEANYVQCSNTHNIVDDMLTLHRIWVSLAPRKVPRIIFVHWIPPALGWLKVNMDVVVMEGGVVEEGFFVPLLVI